MIQAEPGFSGRETALCNTTVGVPVITHLFTRMGCVAPGVNPTVNLGLWEIKMSPCRFDCNKCTPVNDSSRRGCVRVGRGRGIWDLSVLSALFFCERKTSLKK